MLKYDLIKFWLRFVQFHCYGGSLISEILFVKACERDMSGTTEDIVIKLYRCFYPYLSMTLSNFGNNLLNFLVMAGH